MDQLDYYGESKWCPKCRDYVRFLMSVNHCYCIDCGGQVRLFNKKDWVAFHKNLEATAKRQHGHRRVS